MFFFVDPLNMTEINAAMNKLLNDPELAVRMGKEGRKLVEEKYHWAIESQKLTALYSELS